MRWDRNYENSEVEDRRGDAPVSYGGGGGGGGLFGLLQLANLFGWPGLAIGLVIAAVVAVGHNFSGGSHAPRPAQTSAQEDELKKFVGFVFEDVQKTWRAKIPGYHDTHLVIFRNSTHSACGTARTAVGPFYCPLDQKVYIDLEFYDELRRRFGAPGDFAQAYVIAHEVGHHVQNLEGLLGHGGGGREQIHVELQADCLAGAWARDADKRGEVEAGDVDQALNAASQIGDDAIQKRTQGYVRPETFTHGTSEQRSQAFRTGLQGGAEACGIR